MTKQKSGRSTKKKQLTKGKKAAAKAKYKPKVRPLLVRPGAAYTCFGDGLCCTDIHGLGPLTKSEFVQIRRLDKRGAHYDDGFEERMLSTAPDGGCHFLLPDLRCGVHAEYGPEAKPDGCRRFPLGLVATPDGGRITTRHRCPCRTLGERPALQGEDVLPSIADKKGRPRADERVKKVRMGKNAKLGWSGWLEVESEMLAALADGTPPEDVLHADAFPPLKKGKSWNDFADEFLDAGDGTAFGVAAQWMGEMMRALLNSEHVPRFPSRPWARAFDRAEARGGAPRSETEVFADWIADEIWSLEWNEERGFDIARAELATRLKIGRAIAAHLARAEGCRPDRAAAEALTVVELIGESDFWLDVVERIKLP
ncbi:MAG: hypothetical protein AAF411_27325 [Myxococcota bacterium]